jgi:hypothetical protein
MYKKLVPAVDPSFTIISPFATLLLMVKSVEDADKQTPSAPTLNESTVTAPAVKLPLESLATIADAVLAAVAVVAELLTFPLVEIVANFVSAIAALAETSAFTTRLELKTPDPSLCITPAVEKLGIVRDRKSVV